MIVERSERNPLLKPDSSKPWEAEAVFNGCPAKKGLTTYLLYRALSSAHYNNYAKTTMNLSTIGVAESWDGVHFKNRKQLIIPEEPWERFGCEDPRVTKIDNKYYIFYTALSRYPFNADGIKVGVAITKDFKKIQERHLVTPFNAKGMVLFPDKIGDRYWAILTANTDRPPSKISLASFDTESEMWSREYWEDWYKNLDTHTLTLTRRKQDHVEVGAPPIKTNHGWLLLYSYIKNYNTPVVLFTIEAVLLDLENPHKIIARTEMPLLTPDEYYERVGLVPNIVFPSGAMVKGDIIYLYYGATDTTICLTYIELSSLLDRMLEDYKTVTVIRGKENPIIKPDKTRNWESFGTFNPTAIYLENKVRILYRAQSNDFTSALGYAESSDGETIDYKSDEPVYIPREPFEKKAKSEGFSGCEDPRITLMDDKIYMCYTAYDGVNPTRVALSEISREDFLNRNWNWSRPILVTPPEDYNKDALIFPEKVNGQYMIVHRSGDDIDYFFNEDLKFGIYGWAEEHRWINVRKGWWDSRKVGAASTPIRTDAGWIFFYHGVSEDNIYRVGAVLLDLNDPLKIIGRTDVPILEPEAPYELEGNVPNVVFPCGSVLIGDYIYLYYGGADKVVGTAKFRLKELLDIIKRV
ncbi:hypothetical protein JXA34_01835 [Patescibacteria group bacterium]|nr:hypothetical protein [Patescibacteria group bacterium]